MNDAENTLIDSPEFTDAVTSAQTGVFEHTLFEIWEHQLDEYIAVNEGPLEISLADGLLRQWPWLSYADLQAYRDYRAVLLADIKTELLASYPKPAELLFQENADDWESHKDAFLEVLARWTALTRDWDQQWSELALTDRAKAVLHPAIADTAVLLSGPNSLPEYLRDLKGFEITEVDGKQLEERLLELTGALGV